MKSPDEIVCSFFGHGDVEYTSTLQLQIVKTVQDLVYTKGVTAFYFGGFGDFDSEMIRYHQ